MDELRLVRRDDESLIVATDAGDEYRLIVDEDVLSELRYLSRPRRGASMVNPREIQALIRAGKTRAEIMAETGLEESDIERYEEPVLAERSYMLELAHAVPVRTSPSSEAEQAFGVEIAERLIGLSATDASWSAWRDAEAGWMIGLDFTSHDTARRAVWSFDNRKRLLSPLTPEAVNLSKQGDVEDRLIPKLRVVDHGDETTRFDSGAFDPESLSSDDDTPAAEREPGADSTDDTSDLNRSGPIAPDHPSTGSIPVFDPDAEYARRRSIDELAVKSPRTELPDLGETADLLDALRRRRGERDAATTAADDLPDDHASEDDETGVSATITPITSLHAVDPELNAPSFEHDTAPQDIQTTDEEDTPKRGGKGRTSIPSWDDILFGTRGDDDNEPA